MGDFGTLEMAKIELEERYEVVLNRIADALERIADTLEGFDQSNIGVYNCAEEGNQNG